MQIFTAGERVEYTGWGVRSFIPGTYVGRLDGTSLHRVQFDGDDYEASVGDRYLRALRAKG